MFTGLIEEVGTVAAVRITEDGAQLQIVAPRIAKQTKTGESIAVNGCCLTLRSRRAGNLTFDLLEETTARTNLKELRPRHRVNLERALRAEGRLGGHFVQGHVDCASAIVALDRKSADFRLEIQLPGEFAHYVTGKGSVAVNGISLTVADVLANKFVVWIIPYTKRHTNLNYLLAGDVVNLEFDILAKYVDVELRSAVALRWLVRLVEQKKVKRIMSYHNFKSTPPVRVLLTKARAAEAHGANIFKVATRTDTPVQLARLLDFITNENLGLAVSAMGIGRLGAISRVLLARAGSVLIYASIDEASDIEGQLSLKQLRALGI